MRKRTYPTGKTVWQVDGGLKAGKRLQRVFATKAEAVEELARIREEVRESGEAWAALSQRQRVELAEVLEECQAAGLALRQVVAAGLKVLTKDGARSEAVTVRQAAERTLAEKERIGVSEGWAATLKTILASLGRWVAIGGPAAGSVVGDLDIRQLSRELVIEWLEDNGWQPRTKNGYLAGVQVMTSWAVREGFLDHCPLEHLPKWKEVAEEVKRLSVPQCRRLLEVTRAEDPELLGFLGLGLFAGVRPIEIGRLTWGDWRPETGEIVVAASKAKTRQRGVVRVPDPGPAWVELGRAAAARKASDRAVTGPDGTERPVRICPPNFRRRWEAVRVRAGLFADWPEDGLRHTAASMHYALYRDERAVQTMLRHRSAEMLHRHYRALVTEAEAREFYGLAPELRVES